MGILGSRVRCRVTVTATADQKRSDSNCMQSVAVDFFDQLRFAQTAKLYSA